MVSGTRDNPSPEATLSSIYQWRIQTLRLRGGGGGGLDLLDLSTIFPSVISFFFTQNKGGGGRAPPLDPPLFICENVVPVGRVKVNPA